MALMSFTVTFKLKHCLLSYQPGHYVCLGFFSWSAFQVNICFLKLS